MNLANKLKLKIVILICSFFFSNMIIAQEILVSGIVSGADGAILPGANILEKGTLNGTQSDFEGKYSLNITNEDAVLIVSFLGFVTIEEAVDSRTEINFTLQEAAESLDQVVVVGYGTQKRQSVTGSVATVDSEELSVVPVANTTNTLAGRLPGLITKQESGLPGSDGSSLSIRGFGSPLIIVDGIQTDFNNIDANEIESITILKDASAAIYGARAGNGVVLVTTKRGKEGKINIAFNTSTTFQKPTFLPKMASSGQMAELHREAHINRGLPEENQRFSEEDVRIFYAGNNPDYPNTNWYDEVTRDSAPLQQYNLSVRGGSDKIKYYGFLGYSNQETIFKGNAGDYKRFNLRSNVDANITDNLSANIDISHIWEDRDFSWRLTDDPGNTVWQELWDTEPFFNPTNPDGSLAYGGAGGAVGIHALVNKDHTGYNKNVNERLMGSIALNYNFDSVLNGLKARAFVSINKDNGYGKYWRYLPSSYTYVYESDSYIQNTSQSAPDLIHTDNRTRQLTGQLSLSYNTTIADNHDISALALYEVIDNYNEWIRAGRGGYTSTAIQYLFNGGLSAQTSDGRADEMGRQSFVSRLNYSFKSKYLLELAMRVDESAKFNKENRTGYFPSISLGWRLSEEGFFRDNITFIDRLKLRLSYSETGFDNVGNFKYLSGYQAGGVYFVGSSPSTAITTTGLANPNLTWESMKTYNLGVDFSLFNGKLNGEFDMFKRNREGIPGLRTGSLPSTFGATLPTENLNAIETKGFELILGYENNISDFNYKITGNVSKSRSKWTYFDEPVYEDPDQERISKLTGQWTDRTFGYISEGLFTSQEEIDALDYVYDEVQGNSSLAPGDIKYRDVNEDGLLDWRDQVEIGKGTTPNIIAGLNLDLSYKNAFLNALFQGGFGFNQTLVLQRQKNYSELNYNERWTPENNDASALFPRTGGPASNYATSTFYLKNSDYVRLRTISIGYSFPESILKPSGIQTLKLYLAGTNLFTVSDVVKYSIDPESPSGRGGFYYPQMKSIAIGLNLTL
ncbi:SusC/RagA family TonB-linked outer membrane protein [Flagellimonas amoyensis]|uniref:SusC/RagA family TonB-linked outer membrane protein n=1 Tax=Flagellimonas amoyensis TaxID=2169401 RepID=UPI000D3B917D|nr:TonB-dependent receptor [Allomuricauda amoyensis]